MSVVKSLGSAARRSLQWIWDAFISPRWVRYSLILMLFANVGFYAEFGWALLEQSLAGKVQTETKTVTKTVTVPGPKETVLVYLPSKPQGKKSEAPLTTPTHANVLSVAMSLPSPTSSSPSSLPTPGLSPSATPFQESPTSAPVSTLSASESTSSSASSSAPPVTSASPSSAAPSATESIEVSSSTPSSGPSAP